MNYGDKLEEYSDLLKLRREKIDTLRDLNINPYTYNFDTTHYSKQIIKDFEKLENENVSLAGRIMSVRLMGKAAFFHLQDYEGKIQAYIRKDKVGDEAFEVFKLIDIGDFVGVKGIVFKTRTLAQKDVT